jgi:5-methylcytosine-specific restriction endonuclease McrA
MSTFRACTPSYRKGRRTCKKYTSYRKTLREDFLERCGYCNDHEFNSIRDFVIDHFIPQNPDGWTHTISSNVYSNLVYACPYCNAAKSNKWPTKNAAKSHNGKFGFIHPADPNYDALFKRSNAGNILPMKGNPLGIWIKEELKLWHPVHSLNWKFEQLYHQQQILEILFKATKDVSLKSDILQLQALRMQFMDSIFSFRGKL